MHSGSVISYLKALKANDAALLERIEKCEERIKIVENRLNELKCCGDDS